MNFRKLDLVSDDEITTLLSGGEIVTLLGAGISLWSPTNLPSGNSFSEAIFRALFQDEYGRNVDPNEKLLKDIYKSLPFEIVNERCPDELKIRELLRKIFDVYRPNPIHELFAKLIKEQKVQSIITPNYDCSLDSAIARLFNCTIGRDMGDVKRIVRENDIGKTNLSNSLLYIKIHGSTDDETGESLVFRLQQEGVLNPWRRRVFRKAIAGRILLIVGYSGSDFDICPEIPLANPMRIIWNVKEQALNQIPPNPKTVANRIEDTHFISSDMRELLGRIFEPLTANYGPSSLDLEEIIRKKFTEPDRRLWRIRTLNSLTYSYSALTETERFSSEISKGPDFDIEVLSEHAGASANYGNYLQSAFTHDEAARVARIHGLAIETYCRQKLLASDAWRCYGNFPKAFIRHLQVVVGVRELSNPSMSLEAGIYRNEVLMLRHLFDLFNRLFIKPFTWIIQIRVAKIIRKTVEILRRSGEWYPLQQMELWRQRFDLPEEATTLDGEYETPPSLEGYTQLNFPMGKMMAFRQGVNNGDIPININNAREARKLADLARDLGIRPEMWKLHLLILCKFKDEREFRNDFHEFWKAFKACEYSLLFRVWRLIMRD